MAFMHVPHPDYLMQVYNFLKIIHTKKNCAYEFVFRFCAILMKPIS